MSIFTKFFGTHSEKEIKRLQPTLKKIIDLRPSIQALSDEELRAKTDEFKKRYQEGETLDDLLPEAFAVMREATRRCINQEHFEVQLLGGIVLHQGRIAEMKTGEGKTQTALLPAYLNALTGKGVHIVTVNDYLAARDAEWMGQMHRFLGLTVGCVLNGSTSEERKAAYNCDITYVTNNELGFDYLRDNMVIYEKQCVLRGLNYALIDEVDSILIDEARTPLIISGQSGKSTKLYEVCDTLAKRMERGANIVEKSKMDVIMGEETEESGDFMVNEKDKVVNLTAQGIEKIEKFFQIDNYSDSENIELQHNMQLALRANYLMFRDQDYVVKDNEVLIVDEFTGRIMPGRRYSDGLHQAIEAKEHVMVKRESKTLATITFQNFFNKYEKKAGMTGTAQTEETEFRNIYGMDVVEIPTNVPVIRNDMEDAVYKTKAEKYRAVVEEVKEAHATGQPVLVGTVTIEVSELLSQMLKREGIRHNVLNAKFHEMEAEIVSQAGRKGAVTIATNMAGRGTDIKLGGTNTFVQDGQELTNSRTDEEIAAEAQEVKALGGLKIIGTERHEARRIDNQLRGRAGRQGDPGETQFFISLEDDLMRLFGGDRMMSVFNTLGVQEGERIEHKMLSSAIEKAQKRIESNNYSIRENLLKYDQVINEQREIIYAERRQVLAGESMRDVILKMVTDVTDTCVNRFIDDEKPAADWDLNELNQVLLPNIPVDPLVFSESELKGMKKSELAHIIKERAIKLYEQKEAEFPDIEQMRELERVVLLRVIDRHWMDHIDDMDQFRQGIGLMSYGNTDPLTEYRMAGFDMFNSMMAGIREDTVRALYHARVERPEERQQVAKITGTNKDESKAKAPAKRASVKIYPNDPCPCGSGKKYKNCHGRPGAAAL